MTYRGKGFPSSRALAKHVGVNPSMVSYHLRKHGHLEKLGARGKGQPRANSRPLEIFGREFPSISSAARYMGIRENTLRQRIKRGAFDLIRRDMEIADINMRAPCKKP